MSEFQPINLEADLQHDFQPASMDAEVAPKWLKGDKGDRGDKGDPGPQ